MNLQLFDEAMTAIGITPVYIGFGNKKMKQTPEQIRSKALFRKYGINSLLYYKLLSEQGGVCGICGLAPKGRRLAVDHEHVRGYKKMSPECKRKHIRGLLCSYCNYRLLKKGMTLQRARQIVTYLEKFERRLV